MSGYNQTLITSQIDGTALTASTTATSILPGAARLAIPANFFFIGKKLRINALGRISTVTTPGTLTFTLNMGSGGVTNLLVSQALALNASAQTNATFELQFDLTCRVIGTASNMMAVGKFTTRATIGQPAVGTQSGVGVVFIPDTAPVVTSNFDSTIVNILDLFATWGTNNANSIQTHEYEVTDLTYTP